MRAVRHLWVPEAGVWNWKGCNVPSNRNHSIVLWTKYSQINVLNAFNVTFCVLANGDCIFLKLEEASHGVLQAALTLFWRVHGKSQGCSPPLQPWPLHSCPWRSGSGGRQALALSRGWSQCSAPPLGGDKHRHSAQPQGWQCVNECMQCLAWTQLCVLHIQSLNLSPFYTGRRALEVKTSLV